ncbi:hypothetical protein [Caulobacter vibrioides]|uniref:Uncharacterized protein n=1 Tax=Caulobacter phage S2B TaxID=2759120 RepID=A0AAE7MLC1_9CAUD|nr:hypothetical protein [Caulobacter vibrioides]QOC54179.1 hypothetical protein [Caulobacter phage S2B]QXZ50205.1 hypothetical protein KZH45_09740 [Caulobacter vibrioides]
MQLSDAVLTAAADWGYAKLQEEKAWSALQAATYPPEVDELRGVHRRARAAVKAAWLAFDDAVTLWDLEAGQ